MYEKIKDLMRQKKEVDKDYPVSAEEELLEEEVKPKYATGGIVNSMTFVDFWDGHFVPLKTEAKPVAEWEPGNNKVMHASTKPQETPIISTTITGRLVSDEQMVLNLGDPSNDYRLMALNRRIERLEDLVKALEKKVIDLQQAPIIQPYNPVPYPYPYPVYPNPWYDPYRPTITTTGSSDPNVVKYSTTTDGTSIDSGSYKDLDKYYAELLKEGVR